MFGSTLQPVRTQHDISVNYPPDNLLPETFGDDWWIGLHSAYENQVVPSSVTKAESVLINPLVRMPWVLTTSAGTRIAPGDPGYPWWLSDPMLLNGSSGGSNTGGAHMLDRVDRFDFWSRWIRDAMRYGFGVLQVGLDSRKQPLAGSIEGINPFRLYRDDHNKWFLEWGGTMLPVDEFGIVTGTGQRIVILRHSINGGVFGRHRQELQLARRARTYSQEALDSGTPSGVLTTDQPINQKQADTVREEWKQRLSSRGIAVLGNGNRYQQVVMSPVDAEIVSLLQASDRQVAHMYELSSWELDSPSGDSMTYSNISEKRQDRVDGPLASWSARVEETLGALLPAGWTMTIDFSEYTKRTGEVTGSASTDPAGG